MNMKTTRLMREHQEQCFKLPNFSLKKNNFKTENLSKFHKINIQSKMDLRTYNTVQVNFTAYCFRWFFARILKENNKFTNIGLQ